MVYNKNAFRWGRKTKKPRETSCDFISDSLNLSIFAATAENLLEYQTLEV
jgi:hypothetical protein